MDRSHTAACVATPVCLHRARQDPCREKCPRRARQGHPWGHSCSPCPLSARVPSCTSIGFVHVNLSCKQTICSLYLHCPQCLLHPGEHHPLPTTSQKHVYQNTEIHTRHSANGSGLHWSSWHSSGTKAGAAGEETTLQLHFIQADTHHLHALAGHLAPLIQIWVHFSRVSAKNTEGGTQFPELCATVKR